MRIVGIILPCMLVLWGINRPAWAGFQSVRDAIIAELGAQPNFGAHDIDIYARAGFVRLSGKVSSAGDRELVESIARRQPGVTTVQNDLEVAPSKLYEPPSVLATRVRSNLLASQLPGGYNISLSVSGSKVKLSGQAATQQEKELIEQIVRGTSGVTEVVNELTLGPMGIASGRLADDIVAQKVREAWSADPRIDTHNLQVSVKDGIATIRGTTKNHRETDRILAVALMADGVRDIKSELRELDK